MHQRRPVRREQKAQSIAATFQQQTVAGQTQNHQGQQRHQQLVDPFDALLHPCQYHHHGTRQDRKLPADHLRCARLKRTKIGSQCRLRQPRWAAEHVVCEILVSPACDDRVIAQDNQRRDHRHRTCHAPFTGAAQFTERIHNIGLRLPAYRQFSQQQGQAQCHNEHQINQQESAAAILAGDIGKTPDVPQPYRTAQTRQYESGPAAPLFALHDLIHHRWLT